MRIEGDISQLPNREGGRKVTIKEEKKTVFGFLVLLCVSATSL